MSKLEDWLLERRRNCIRIARTKKNRNDRAGWLEYAAYFQMAILAVQRLDQLDSRFLRPPSGYIGERDKAIK